MIIKSYNGLGDKIIKEILQLEDICNKQDKLRGSLFLDTSLNYNDQIKSIFLLYENRELISVLAMFIPSRLEAEISALTSPKYRCNGYFKALLSRAVEELKKFGIREILFVCERQSRSGKEVMDSLQAKYEHTEYTMRFIEASCSPLNTCRLALHRPHISELDKIIRASRRIFSESYADSKRRIEKCLNSNDRDQYLGVRNEEIVGIGSVNLIRDEASLFAFGIMPEYRDQGYGKELLRLIIDHLWQSGKTEIMLEVNSSNAAALKLYKKSGFRIEVVLEYYRKKVSEI